MRIWEGLVILDPQIKRARIGYQDQAISILSYSTTWFPALFTYTISNVQILTYYTQLMYIKNLS